MLCSASDGDDRSHLHRPQRRGCAQLEPLWRGSDVAVREKALWRLLLRLAVGHWERPATADWWRSALADEGLVDVHVTVLDHEGGVATAWRPLRY